MSKDFIGKSGLAELILAERSGDAILKAQLV